MADERTAFEESPEYKAWLRSQSGIAKWFISKRRELQLNDAKTDATYLRTVTANQHALKEENYLWSCSIVRPDDYFRGRRPETAAFASHGLFMSPYQIRAKELKGELIRWNFWHSWDLNPTEDPRDTSKYPKPTKYDPLNPPRPNIRAKRLARQAASHE